MTWSKLSIDKRTKMIFAKVVGTIVSTQKDENLNGKKLLLCKEVDHAGNPLKAYHVAVDAVQAGEGSFVTLVLWVVSTDDRDDEECTN